MSLLTPAEQLKHAGELHKEATAIFRSLAANLPTPFPLKVYDIVMWRSGFEAEGEEGEYAIVTAADVRDWVGGIGCHVGLVVLDKDSEPELIKVDYLSANFELVFTDVPGEKFPDSTAAVWKPCDHHPCDVSRPLANVKPMVDRIRHRQDELTDAVNKEFPDSHVNFGRQPEVYALLHWVAGNTKRRE